MSALNIQRKHIEYSGKCPNCEQFVMYGDTHCTDYDVVYGYFDDDGTEYTIEEYMIWQEMNYDGPEYNPEEYL